MICVIKSGPHKDLMNSDFPCPWYQLLFQMSSFPQILTLFWTCVFIPSPEWFILVFLTLNLTPLPILKNVHYFHRQSPLQHFTFHWGSFSVARKAHITLLNTDRIKQHGAMCGIKTFPAQTLLGCLSATQRAEGKQWLLQIIRRQWLNWGDHFPWGKHTLCTEF